MSLLYDAMPDIREGITANGERKLEIARKAIDEVEMEVRSLMDEPWRALLVAARDVEVTLDGMIEGVQRQEE